MRTERFSLLRVEIYSLTDIEMRKRLLPGSFVFEKSTSKSVMDDFWGKNISIHAIVGKNGSGKSTLLDFILILINNFSYYVLKNSWINESIYNWLLLNSLQVISRKYGRSL